MSSIEKVIGFIPARIGSVRLKEKLLSIIDGKTLIQLTYENALKCKKLDSLIIATDSTKIFDLAKSFNAEVIMTSPDCKNGTERIAEAIKNYSFPKESLIVNIQGDEPNINPLVIEKIIDTLIQEPCCQMATACSKIKSKEEALNPSVVKCVFNKLGHALYFSRGMIPYGKQGEFNPEISYYRHHGIYVYKKDFLKLYTLLSNSPLQIAEDLEQLRALEHGYCIKIIEVDEYGFGIDTQEDLDNYIKMRAST